MFYSCRQLIGCCILLVLTCGELLAGPTVNVTARPLQRGADSDHDKMFVEVPAAASGVDFLHPIDLKHERKYLYVGGFASAGVAIGDVNGDGLQDLFFSGGPVKNRLYIQLPKTAATDGLRFRDAGFVDRDNAWAAGAAMVDIDNDGDLDIYVCYYDAPNQLFINRTTSPEKIAFQESATSYGLDLVDASLMPAFCDYDLDGDLDVFVTAYQYVNPDGRPKTPPVIERNGRYFVKPDYQKYYGVVQGVGGQPTFTNIGREDYLLQNNLAQVRDRTKIRFTDVTKQAGIEGLGVGNSMLWWDFDQDGLPDIYIANDFKVADQLYHNNGDGTFTDVIRQCFSHTTWFSMGSEVGDINNDGLMDLLVSDMAGTTHYRSKVTMGEMGKNVDFLKTSEPRQLMRNALLINTGTTRFMEAAYMTGLANSDWTWATKLADFDNDGWLDVYFTNGAARVFNHSDRVFSTTDRIGKTQWAMWEDSEPRLEENLAFRNLGDFAFEDVSQKWGLKKKGMSYSAAYADLDNDGDLDLVVTHLDEPVSIYENKSASGSGIRVGLVGTRSNRFGLGAIIRIETDGGAQVRQMMPASGFMSCNEPFVHFGVGDAQRINKLTIQWPSGIHQELSDLEVDQLYMVTEPKDGERSISPGVSTDKPQFVASRTFPALRHIEKEFDDFERQPLLPFKHSQLGPGIAISDVDGDGDMDYYLGRPKGSRRAVLTNAGRSNLKVNSMDAFQSDAEFEDMGVLFFDADRDGDQDLYAVSGGVECEPRAAVLKDRLYVNNGKGVFSKASDGAIPDVRDSGSVVCAADFDRDGDLDLFVGSRIIPGQYPMTPVSRLLVNESHPGKIRFADATQQVAPKLKSTGLVTSAVWSDADNDGWIDLLVSHDWGPVKYFRNESNDGSRTLVDRTNEAGLSDRLGWWNGIAARDLDNDGDIDYVVTNFGLNTTYHPSRDKPELLYYGDFDGSGKPHLVEAKFENGQCFPRRGLSCSSHAMPFVREKLKTFHEFGLATLDDIYTEQNLFKSLQLQANMLESGVLINTRDGKSSIPKFVFQALPRLAQISPAFGAVLEDFDADGLADCFLAQNFFSPQIETGRMDSGLSLLLRGKATSGSDAIEFEPVWPRQSGVIIPGDAKAVSVTDFNQDGWNDLLITVNNGTIEAFEGRPHDENRKLRVTLLGPPGNPTCVGASVTVRFKNSSEMRRSEVYAGGGYLSQSTSRLTFGCGPTLEPKEILVRWSDGKTTTYQIPKGKWQVAARKP